MATIEESIELTATRPAEVRIDNTGSTVVSQDISKQIEADKYLSAKSAQSKNHCGLSFRTLKPGGCG